MKTTGTRRSIWLATPTDRSTLSTCSHTLLKPGRTNTSTDSRQSQVTGPARGSYRWPQRKQYESSMHQCQLSRMVAAQSGNSFPFRSNDAGYCCATFLYVRHLYSGSLWTPPRRQVKDHALCDGALDSKGCSALFSSRSPAVRIVHHRPSFSRFIPPFLKVRRIPHERPSRSL